LWSLVVEVVDLVQSVLLNVLLVVVVLVDLELELVFP
jgi:hypothetical protein